MFQDWTTIEIPASDTEVVQTQDGWVDTAGYQYAANMAQIPGITHCALKLDCAVNAEGPWRELGMWDSRPSTDDYSEFQIGSNRPDDADENRFDRYVRWRVKSEQTAVPEAGWVCFRLVAVLKS